MCVSVGLLVFVTGVACCLWENQPSVVWCSPTEVGAATHGCASGTSLPTLSTCYCTHLFLFTISKVLPVLILLSPRKNCMHFFTYPLKMLQLFCPPSQNIHMSLMIFVYCTHSKKLHVLVCLLSQKNDMYFFAYPLKCSRCTFLKG